MPSNMLPLPSSTSRRNRNYFPSISPGGSSIHNLTSSQQILQTLRSRTRLTNLAVFLLISCLFGSFILNLNYLFISPAQTTIPDSSSRSSSTGGWLNSQSKGNSIKEGWEDELTSIEQMQSKLPLSIETTLERDKRFKELNHLIMIPGHAIWLGNKNNEKDISNIRENGDWILESMQKSGSVKTYIKHIEKGVEELKNDHQALLIFSGGATRPPPSPPLSEGLSYHNLAHALDLLPSTPIPIEEGNQKPPLPLNLRATTEEFALDSYQNLLFSIARFKEVTSRYPEKVTVVGYGMKRNRFVNLHREAIGFPLEKFKYIGINDDLKDLSKHYKGELKFGFKPFLISTTGCKSILLKNKKLNRNPFKKVHPYHISNPSLINLFEWCPTINEKYKNIDKSDQDNLEDYDNIFGLTFNGPLPWNNVSYNPKDSNNDEITWSRERD
ncbi:uncharacterized protein L201_002095 [Kwoniella dendrophila CBS 6074]|uniref:Cytoplasmic protein n=1 Tax=Kwoniella dendrophila CBS 6074 TaxID=1295534 RepID=A0AAX4JRU7_9TREE